MSPAGEITPKIEAIGPAPAEFRGARTLACRVPILRDACCAVGQKRPQQSRSRRQRCQFSPRASPALSRPCLSGSDRLGDDRRHQAIDADALVLRLSRQLRVESSRQALTPLRSLDAWLRQLSTRLSKHFHAIAKGFPAVCDRLFDGVPIRHASGYIRILHQVTATLVV